MTTTVFGKAWGVLMLSLVILESILVGLALRAGQWDNAIFAILFLAFWVFAVVWFHIMALREREGDVELRHQKEEMKKNVDKLLAEMLKGFDEAHGHDKALEDALDQATQEIKKGNRTPLKPSEYAKVEKRFHEITGDHYIKLTQNKNGKADVTISDTPFTKPTTKKAPVKKPVVKAAPVTKKPVTKKGK